MNQPQKQLKILLIGDSCYDYYHYGVVNRISPEAPIPVFDFSHTEKKSGMASNVYENLKALNVNVDIFTTFSENKNRYIDIKTKQQLLRVDEKIDNSCFESNTNDFNYNDYDAVVISDYNKGFLSYENILEVRDLFSGPMFIDTKKKDLSVFEDCTLKLNQYEWSSRISDHNDVIVTHGSEKVTYKGNTYYPPQVQAYDVCGAGDTFLAAFVYKRLTASAEDAILFAIKASAITVQNNGVYAPSLQEIEND